nr:immunoglobulin heavy chain junction region [Macaca mulatta]
CARKDSNFDYW